MSRIRERKNMVEHQIRARGIKNENLLKAFYLVPRHRFVPSRLKENAYEDRPLPIGEGQTISQPYIVALMTSLADIKPGEKVLEVGTGSAYQTAILAFMGCRVYSIERNKELARKAAKLLKKLNINDIKLCVGDGSRGWPENGPYDAVIVTAAAPSPPEPLLSQLADGGRLVIPVGGKDLQELMVYLREGGGIKNISGGGCRFVPLKGEYGWKD